MNCPKCNHKMLEERAVSRASSTYNTSLVSSSLVHGMSCWNCGSWVAIDPIVMPMPAKQLNVPRGAAQQTNPIVEKYFDSITKQRSIGATWECIALLISKACKVKLCPSTIIKNYKRLANAKQI